MEEEQLKSIAAQLRRPHGEFAIQVGEMMNKGNLNINLYTIEALGLQSSDQVLEIGMGNGFFVKDILSAGESVHYTGCDFSESMVQEARNRNAGFVDEGRAVFHFANAEELPLENESFDKIFTINTIYFWENREKVLNEFSRLLKTDGKLIIAIRPKSQMDHYPFVKYGFNTFSKEDLGELLSKNGFEIHEITERNEPTEEIAGEMLILETLIVSASKKKK